MATDTAERRTAHIRGLTVTTLACLAGIAAALASQAIVVPAAASTAAAATSNTALYILVGSILAQFPLLKLLGIDVEDFDAKDFLYVAFMTFSLWFVAWAVLLTAGTQI